MSIIVADDSNGRRSMMSSALKQMGYNNITPSPLGRDILTTLSADQSFTWIVGMLNMDDNPNLLQILALIANTPSLKHIFVSIFVKSDNDNLIPKAYELGLLSHHPNIFSPDQVFATLGNVVSYMSRDDADTREFASQNLRAYLVESKEYKSLLTLEQKISNINSGSPEHFFHLAKAEVLAGDSKPGVKKLRQLQICFPDYATRVEEFATKNASEEWVPSEDQKLFDDRETHILCNDEESTARITKVFSELGINSCTPFTSYSSYNTFLKGKKLPQLFLFDWNLADIENTTLIQRLQSIEGFTDNIMILSEFGDPSADKQLLSELGLFGCIKSPFDSKSIGQELLRLSREINFPKSGEALEYKIRKAIKRGKISEAMDLYQSTKDNASVKESDRMFMRAQIEFAKGEHSKAAKLTIESIKLSGDTIATLNFLGKCMMVLGKFDFAISCFNKANELAPGSIERLCGLSLAKFEANDEEGAKKTLAEARDIDPESSATIMTETTQDLRSGNVNKAKQNLLRLKSHLGLSAGLNNSAIANIRANRVEDAIKLYVSAQESLPENLSSEKMTIQYNFALALARLNRDLDKIPELLNNVVSQSKSQSLQKKAQSLLKRTNVSLVTGQPVNLRLNTESITPKQEFKNEDSDTAITSLSEISDQRVKEKGLLGLFVSTRELDTSLKNQLANLPKLNIIKGPALPTPATDAAPTEEA